MHEGATLPLPSQAICEAFAEIRDSDPRLVIVLAFARIHHKLDEMIQQTGARQTNGRLPVRFKTVCTALARERAFEPGLCEFLKLLSVVRNDICHRPSDLSTLQQEPTLGRLERMRSIAGVVGSVENDLRGVVHQMCVAAVAAIELDSCQPKGFEQLRRAGYAVCQ